MVKNRTPLFFCNNITIGTNAYISRYKMSNSEELKIEAISFFSHLIVFTLKEKNVTPKGKNCYP